MVQALYEMQGITNCKLARFWVALLLSFGLYLIEISENIEKRGASIRGIKAPSDSNRV